MAFKLITFVIGLVTLIYGSITLGIRDWDIGVSVLLATYTLATAEWVISVLWNKEYLKYPIALLSILSPYALYVFYWSVQGKEAVMFEGQIGLVISLYLICGLLWTASRKLREAPDSILQMKVGFFRG